MLPLADQVKVMETLAAVPEVPPAGGDIMVSELNAGLTQPVSPAVWDTAQEPEPLLHSSLPTAEGANIRGGPQPSAKIRSGRSPPAAGSLHRKSMSWAAGSEPSSPPKERGEESLLPGLSDTPLLAVGGGRGDELRLLPTSHPALASWPPRQQQQQQPFVPQQPFAPLPVSAPPLPRTHTISVTSTLPGTMIPPPRSGWVLPASPPVGTLVPPPRSGWVRPASPPAAGAAVPLVPAAPPPAAATESSSVPSGLVPLGIITMEDVIEEMMQV